MMGAMERSATTMGTSWRQVVPAVLAVLSVAFSRDRDGAVAQYLRLKELDPALAQDLYRRIFP